MKTSVVIGVATLMLAGCAGLGGPASRNVGPGGVLDNNTGIMTKPSKYSVAETMDKMEASAKAVGAHIFSRVDWQEASKKVNVEIAPNQLLIFGRGKGGPFIIKEAPLAALDIPFKAVAWQDAQGKVWLSYTNGTYVGQRYAIGGAANASKDIDATIEKITDEALK
jgi:uncharacterized protein (DUF302 family)